MHFVFSSPGIDDLLYRPCPFFLCQLSVSLLIHSSQVHLCLQVYIRGGPYEQCCGQLKSKVELERSSTIIYIRYSIAVPNRKQAGTSVKQMLNTARKDQTILWDIRVNDCLKDKRTDFSLEFVASSCFLKLMTHTYKVFYFSQWTQNEKNLFDDTCTSTCYITTWMWSATWLLAQALDCSVCTFDVQELKLV